jgi:DNA-binding LacI/PurR family transcriptional regulator
MRLQRVAGLIVIPTRSDAEHGARLIGQIHVPTVLLDMFVEGLPYHVIKTDNVEAGWLATDHLLSLGHRRIGIIVGIEGLATSDDRHRGYLLAHEQHGVPVDPSLKVAGDFDQQHSHDVAKALLARPAPPSAVVAISNMTTFGTLFALRELKLRVPEDISLVGIDDLEFSGILDPSPTVVETPILHMSRRAIQHLLLEIGGGIGEDEPWEIHQPHLIIRQSTRPL